GLTVDATGEVEIPAVSTAALNSTNLAGQPGGDYVFKVVIQDALGQYIEQDVMLDVVATPNQVCGITVSETSPSVVVGNALDLIIEVNDPDPLNALTIVTIPAAIPNATLTPVGTNPVTAIFHFVPDGSQGGQTIGVNFVATDNGSPPLSCVVNAQITVISNLPPTCEGDFTNADLSFDHPSPGSYVVTEEETITIPFTGTDPNGDNLTASVTGLPGGASLAPSSGPAPLVATLSWTPTAADKAGAPYTVVVTFDDGAGGSHSCSFVIEDINLKPVCNSGGDLEGSVTYECTSASGAVVMLNGSGTDADDATLLYHSDVSDLAVVLDNPNIANPTGVFPHGVTMATLTVADGRGGVSICDLLVEVEDTIPPEVMCTTSVASLWPPNHTMREVTLVVTATDACEAPAEVIPLIVTVRSDEEDDETGVGDGQTTGDVNGQDGFAAAVDVSADFVQGILPGTYVATILLRAERQGTSDGRKYTIDVAALDSASNIATTSCCVIVPHDRRGSN
ncbi:MAG: putative Ig domain-containing protein, partial [Planctomycetes bacterium]|nr:putative Ig domain-containing protein [Planctomycetota bacterium]